MGSPQKMSRLQKICRNMAIFDILFFFTSIVASVIIENSVTEMRPMKIMLSDNGTVSVSFSEKDELMAVWDFLYQHHYSSSGLYNAVYMSLVIIAVSYFILEVWLCCLLILGSTEKSVTHCRKWFWWRMLILLLTVMVAASDLLQMQYTLTLLVFIPLNVFRMSLIVLVLQLVAEYKGKEGVGGDNFA